MAKKKRGGKKKGKGSNQVVLAGLAGHLLGRVANRLVDDGFDVLTSGLGPKKKHDGAKHDAKNGHGGRDVAAEVLKALAKHGAQSIPDLLDHTRAGLAALLRALKDIREFHLIEFRPDDDRIHLTSSGDRAATVLSKNGIREGAALLLDS